MAWAILDSNVYIDYWQGDAAIKEALASIRQTFVIRHSSVVLSELRRGARTSAAQQVVEELFSLAAIQWCPTEEDWWTAGKLIRVIGDAQQWDASKRREFQNDTLIALTARRHGATIVTRNRLDFDLLRKRLAVQIAYI